MRVVVIPVALLALLALAVVVGPSSLAASSSQNQVWATFTHPIMFSDRLLPEGEYLIVHDDAKKAMGEPCLYVYGKTDMAAPLVAVHCRRVSQRSTDKTKIVWSGPTPATETRQFVYVQFGAEDFAHYVR